MHVGPAPRRAFTLLELMLAAMIGGIVAIAAWSVFAYVARAQDLQTHRMAVASDMATAHRALSRAFQMMVMSDEPTPRDEEIKERENRTRRAESDPSLSDPPEELAEVRLRLAPGRPLSLPAADRPFPTQVMEVALRAPAVLGGLPALPSERAIAGASAHIRPASDRPSRRDRRDDRAASSSRGNRSAASNSAIAAAESDRSSSAGDKPKPKRPTGSRAGNTDTAAAAGGDDAADAFADEVASTRQPGVRAVFELLPDGQLPQELASADDYTRRLALRRPLDELAALSGLSLWYREVPPEDQGGADLPRRAIRLLSGLREAQWRVYRDDIAEPRITAIWANELPAYVTFEFTTHDNRRERWMFEVGWATGPMPGEVTDSRVEEARRLNDGRRIDTPGNPTDGKTPTPNSSGNQ